MVDVLLFRLQLSLLVNANYILELLEFLQYFFKGLGVHHKAALFFTRRCNVVGLIKDHYTVFELNFKVLSDLLVHKVIVRHEDYVGSRDPLLHSVVRTEELVLADLV